MNGSILLVDDEPDLEALVVQKFRRQIQDGSVRFLFAHDGVEALAVLEARPDVAVVLTDINMPRMDGLTLLQKLQAIESRPSTVIVSAYGDMANIRTAMNRGAFDFLTKPIDLADLETTIARTLRHVEALREAGRRQAEAERARATLSRYFSPNLAERLSGDAAAVDLAGQRREVASLFTDIAAFTALAETIDLAVLGRLLNEYLTLMTDIVFAHEGTVAKVVGDALHVLFGAPGEQPDHAGRAVACALALDAAAQALRAGWLAAGVALGATRIGLNAGPAIVGNFGGSRYFDYTAYGDTINIAARLEGANKTLGTRVIASDAIAERTLGFRGRPVGDLLLRGRSEPIRAFEPLEQEAFEEPATAAYLAAFAMMEAGDPAALPALAAEVARRPGDRLLAFHLRRLLNGGTGVRIPID